MHSLLGKAFSSAPISGGSWFLDCTCWSWLLRYFTGARVCLIAVFCLFVLKLSRFFLYLEPRFWNWSRDGTVKLLECDEKMILSFWTVETFRKVILFAACPTEFWMEIFFVV